MIRMMQSQQESVSRACAEARESCDVRYGTELVDFEQRPSGQVLALVKSIATQEQSELRARYMVACEGPAGPVGKKLKTKFDGFVNVAKTQSTLIRAPGLWVKVCYREAFFLQAFKI